MRLKYLDVLKAVAIVAVVLYHSGFLTYGYLGVDLFLVINGYLITRGLKSKLLNTPSQGGLREYMDFEISRILRLLPVLLVAGIVCIILGYFVMLPDDYENLSQSVIASNLFGNNILAAITTKNYWDVVNEYKPLMHTWYVGVVMQFYLVYPLLFFIAKLGRRNAQQTLLIMISVLAVISLLIYFGTANIAHRFYYLPSRFFEFAVGGIVALAWRPQEGNRIFARWFVYVCYVLLVALMVENREIVESNIKLVMVVVLSVVMIMSSGVLENRVTANGVIAKVGAASYSIFIWHQVLLAFYRYVISSHFTVVSYALLLVAVAILSWITYQFIEQECSRFKKGVKSYSVFISIVVVVWLSLTVFSGYIYKVGGVVRDVPELYISKNGKVDHKAYNDKIYKYDNPFITDKHHWLVVGNSFGRDFANVILESSVSDSIELSYIFIDKYDKPEYAERFSTAERVFLSSLGTDEAEIMKMEMVCQRNGVPLDNLVVVGVKNFGESNGQFYIRRGKPDYFKQRVKMEEGYMERNNNLKSICGDNYLDIIGLVIDDQGKMPVYSDHHFVSQDCRHFSKGGAIWFAQLIDWSKYLK